MWYPEALKPRQQLLFSRRKGLVTRPVSVLTLVDPTRGLTTPVSLPRPV